jgi:putative hydrolase of the HAD superfamily
LPYKFIYFDLDDTLLDHKSAEVAGLRDVQNHFSFLDAIAAEDLVATYGKVNSRQWTLYSQGDISRDELQRNRFEQTLEQLDVDASRYEEVGSYYMQAYRNHWQWIDGAQEAYRQVLDHFPVGILTNGFAETQRLKFERFDFDQSAEYTIVSEDVGVLKPDPKVFEHATTLANVAPDDILYVGDSLRSDIEGGSKFGWNVAWYTQNGDAKQHHKADFVFNDFTNLITFLNL